MKRASARRSAAFGSRPLVASKGNSASRRVVLTIAGSDGTGGAGLQADLATFRALGVLGVSAVTAVTAQDTRGVHAAWVMRPAVVAAQLKAVLDDLRPVAVKTGMLGNRAVVETVAEVLGASRVRALVVDPVIHATSGATLLDPPGVRALRDRLLPIARVVTPNLAEAAALAGFSVVDLASAEEAARRILALGPSTVVVTGGHLTGEPVDVVADRRGVRLLRGRRVRRGAHGTGCVFAAAIAAHLAVGRSVEDSVRGAKRFVEDRLRYAVRLGAGRPILDLRDVRAASRMSRR
jgi:hydroxymethylpyrimidine kinase/phosphomethylpyrimidine kinase